MLNHYQESVIGWVRTGRGHGIVGAVAGSGKSTLLVAAASQIQGQGLFVAFNKSIADELGSKLRGTAMTASTIHSLGFGAIKAKFGSRIKVDKNKVKTYINRWWDSCVEDPTWNDMWEQVWPSESESAYLSEQGLPDSVFRLLDLARAEMYDPRTQGESFLTQVCDHHSLEIDSEIFSLMCRVVRWVLTQCLNNTHSIDFTDMIWLPAILGLRPQNTYSWVFVDECQDLSKAQRATVRLALAPGGRLLAVGDPYQAIYGFAGADADSFQSLKAEFDATEMPLSICYRCPTSHVELARQICPQIEARPDAPAGIVRQVEKEDIVDDVVEGSMIICRTNAPMVRVAYDLISNGISAALVGRDLGAGLKFLVKKFFGKSSRGSFTHADLFSKLSAYLSEETQKAQDRGGSSEQISARLEALEDRVECVRSVATANPQALTVGAFCKAVDNIFDNERPSVRLSSVHRAKGLEADRVYLLQPHKLGDTSRCVSEWQGKQEKNLHYVALTRSRNELVYIK